MFTVVPHRFSVPFEEMDGSPTEFVTRSWGGTGARRTLKCLTSNRVQLVNELLGYVDYYGGTATIHPPAPYGPDILNIVVSDVAIKPFGKMGQISSDTRFADYDYSIIEVTFEAADKVLSSVYGYVSILETIRPASEFITLPTKELYWGVGGAAEAIDAFDAPGKINKMLEWTYEIRGASAYPVEIWKHIGKVNYAVTTSASLGVTFGIETLLYAGPIVEKEITLSGTIYNITLRFIYKNNGPIGTPYGWNYFPRISAAGSTITFENITDGTNPKLFYPYADFTEIFVP